MEIGFLLMLQSMFTFAVCYLLQKITLLNNRSQTTKLLEFETQDELIVTLLADLRIVADKFLFGFFTWGKPSWQKVQEFTR